MGVSEETNGFSQVMASRIVTCRKTQGAVVPEKRGGRVGDTKVWRDRYPSPVLFVSQNTRLVEDNMKLGYTEI